MCYYGRPYLETHIRPVSTIATGSLLIATHLHSRSCLRRDKPEEIVVACNGSPMVIGLGQGKTFIASETSAFSRYTKVRRALLSIPSCRPLSILI